VFTDENNFTDVPGFKHLTVAQFLSNCLNRLMPERVGATGFVATGSQQAANVFSGFYSEYLEKYPQIKDKVVDDAEVYITCELTNNFLETMNTLKDHFSDKPDVFICMDRVTHRTPSSGEV
jgi:hypothetical protein